MRRKVLCSLLVIALVLLLGLIIGNRQSFASDSLTDEEYAIRSQNSLFFIDRILRFLRFFMKQISTQS